MVFGRADNFPSVVSLDRLSAADGFVIQCGTDGERCGISVAWAGDVNHDGVGDMIVGAHSAPGYAVPQHPDAAFRKGPYEKQAGAAYIIFGSRIFPTALDVRDLNGSNGFAARGSQRYELAGLSVAGAGDVNQVRRSKLSPEPVVAPYKRQSLPVLRMA